MDEIAELKQDIADLTLNLMVQMLISDWLLRDYLNRLPDPVAALTTVKTAISESNVRLASRRPHGPDRLVDDRTRAESQVLAQAVLDGMRNVVASAAAKRKRSPR